MARPTLEYAKSIVKRPLRLLARLAPPALVARLVPESQRFSPATVTPAISIPATRAPSTEVRLFIAPTNSAGQGWAWARAAERLPGVTSRTMAIQGRGRFGFPADQRVPAGEYRWSRRWQASQRRAVLAGFTHVLVESATPLFGDPFGRSVRDDLRALRRADIAVALVFHGTDIRLPSRHRGRSPWSPLTDALWSLTPALERQAQRNADLVKGEDAPVYVSTPDLLLDLPEAEWLPVVVDPQRWETTEPPRVGSARAPRVVHVPSSAVVKGTELIEPVLDTLASEGLIEYGSLRGLTRDEMTDAYRAADIVVDQVRIGNYGVAACEAMAAGRIVVSHVDEYTRREVRDRTGLELPIVEATADTLQRVLRDIVVHPAPALEIASRGPRFVAEVHDGRRSAAVLAPFLGVDASSGENTRLSEEPG